MAEPYTEKQAIAALQRVAKRWPSSLRLFSWSGGLVCIDAETNSDQGGNGIVTVGPRIDIPNDGGDPDYGGEREPRDG